MIFIPARSKKSSLHMEKHSLTRKFPSRYQLEHTDASPPEVVSVRQYLYSDPPYPAVLMRFGALLASKFMIDTGAGVIDADYRGVVFVLLFNHSDKDFQGKFYLLIV
jgi:dUTPase